MSRSLLKVCFAYIKNSLNLFQLIKHTNMKKLFLGLLVAAFTLSIYSCRETTEENVENNLEEVETDLEETGEDIESGLEEAGDEIEQAGEQTEQEIEEEINETDDIQ